MIRQPTISEGFAVGAYSFADAARFIGATSSELRRWMMGYTRRGKNGEAIYSQPLWTNQLAETGIEGLGFRDLIELRFVHTFRAAGVSLNVIRGTINVAREKLSAPYPFTCKKFRTDGKRIFLEALEESGDESLVDVQKQQNMIRKVIGPSLREGIELDMQGEASRWYPVKGSKTIVFDPNRRFGQPILTDFDIPTIAISEAVRAEAGETQDHHHRRQIERQAISVEGLLVFVLSKVWASQSYYAKASRLIDGWPRIAEQSAMVRAPVVYRVPWKSGKFEVIRNVR